MPMTRDYGMPLSAIDGRVCGRLRQNSLPLLSMQSAFPLTAQSSHLSFQEFFAARALCRIAVPTVSRDRRSRSRSRERFPSAFHCGRETTPRTAAFDAA